MKRKLETLETSGEGNTRTSPEKKKRVVQGRYWCFTWWSGDLDKMEGVLERLQIKYIIGIEHGNEFMGEDWSNDHDYHLQGYLESEDAIRPIEKLKLDRSIHWEKRKGTKLQNLRYCAKEGNFRYSGVDMKPPRELKLITPREGWQKEIVDLVQTEPDERSIYWFWETAGGIGKTVLCKYLTKKHGAICLGGKCADMKNGIVDYVKNNGVCPEIIVVNIPRDQEEYVSYQGMEAVKDMYFYSGKYEGGQVCGPNPHLIVFANFEPQRDRLSEDRWKVQEISAPPPLDAAAPQGEK